MAEAPQTQQPIPTQAPTVETKPFAQRFKKRFHFNPWFGGAVVLTALVVFTGSELWFRHINRQTELESMRVGPLEEGLVYDGPSHNIGDDFNLLNKTVTSNLNGATIAKLPGSEQPIAVVVENYTPIRDLQSGLDKASFIYETLAEGGITRFLVIFDGSPVDRIGPVRSARPYFVTWASELRAAFVHVGGSSEALGDLKSNFRILNVDEFSDYKTVWRDNKLLAPHNAFTSTDDVRERLKRDGYDHPLKTPRFKFKDADPTPGTIKTISIDFSLTPYAVKYEFDPTTKTYARTNGGKPHHDLKPANVVVQFADTQVLDEIGRLRIQTHGTGKAIVFRDGQAIEGTWEKDGSINSDDQPIDQGWTKFFDKDGNEIPLNRGQTFIEVVPNGRTVNYF